MQKIIGVTELQRRFRSVFDEVAHQRVPYILTRGSRPEVVLMPYDDFLHYQEMEEQQIFARFGQLENRMAAQNAGYSDDEVAQDMIEDMEAALEQLQMIAADLGAAE